MPWILNLLPVIAILLMFLIFFQVKKNRAQNAGAFLSDGPLKSQVMVSGLQFTYDYKPPARRRNGHIPSNLVIHLQQNYPVCFMFSKETKQDHFIRNLGFSAEYVTGRDEFHDKFHIATSHVDLSRDLLENSNLKEIGEKSDAL